MFLLAEYRHQVRVFAGLDIEDSLPRIADGIGCDSIDRIQVKYLVGHGHRSSAFPCTLVSKEGRS